MWAKYSGCSWFWIYIKLCTVTIRRVWLVRLKLYTKCFRLKQNHSRIIFNDRSVKRGVNNLFGTAI